MLASLPSSAGPGIPADAAAVLFLCGSARERGGGVTSDEKFMQIALAEARLALGERHYPCGCVLVVGGRVVATGRNEVYRRRDPTRHGEMVALEAAFRRPGASSVLLPGSTAYVTAEPCLMCAGAFLQAGVEHVVFGAPSGDHGSLRTGDILRASGLADQIGWRGGVLADECRTLLREWMDYRQQVLAQLEGRSATDVASLLRIEGLTMAHVSAWRAERAAGHPAQPSVPP